MTSQNGDFEHARRVQDELRRSNDRLRDFAEAAADWFFEMDKDLRFTYVSERHQDVVGVPPEAVIGKTRWDAHQDRRLPEEEEQWREHIATMRAHKSWTDFTYTLIRDDAQRRVISNSAKAIFDSNGDFSGYRGVGRDVTAKSDAEAALSSVQRIVPDAVITIDELGCIASFNPAAEKVFGYTASEAIGHNVKMLMPQPYRQEHDGYLSHYKATGHKKIIGIGREVQAQKKDGTVFPIRLAVDEMAVAGQRMYTGVVHDLTESHRREALLRQSQKMEAIGQLTGGIAHDFNNLLTVILGNLEMLSTKQTDGARAAKLLEAASSAAERGAQLTTQLLSFARQQPLSPEVINVNDLVDDMSDMLKRTLGETIEFHAVLDEDVDSTFIDPVQLHNALLNLTINARDAMPRGGRLTIETSNVDLDADEARLRADADPGHYVRMSVTDTGVGMPPEVQARVLEPFFTTKEQGKGTGLGLSMVHGFAKQSGGHVEIYSEIGYGTSISLYLPDANDDAAPRATSRAQAPVRKEGPSETVLVVEDDPNVREITVARLDHLGYLIVEAETGQQALDILAKGTTVDVLLTDMVMPGGMTGAELADRVRATYPKARVILTSGYARDGSIPESGTPWLRKPYSLADLEKTLHDLLD
ncbi:MAG: PAS domain S-box protein [Hyphomicrobiaceae bacterium]